MIDYLLSIPKTYLFALLSGFSWSLTTILAKHYLLKAVTPLDLYVLRMGLGFPILSLLIILLVSYSIIDPSSIQKHTTTNTPINYLQHIINIITKKTTPKLLIAFIISIIAGFFGIYMFWKVLEINNGSYSVAFVWPLVVLFTTLISYFIFNEKISTFQSIGIGLVIAGLFMLNLKS
mgnify:CR=1 FL=1|jgi:uncharacterized membrane protein